MDAILARELYSAVELNLASTLKLTFVADQVNAHILRGVLLYLLEPAAEVLEGFVASDVVCEEDAVGAAIENSRHRLKRFLPRGVPNLEFDDFSIDQEAVAAEFDANGDLVLLLELVVHDALHEARLAHRSVPNNDQLV
eukprot:CAMPEP_0185581810 /NCGR_PEP_ID=MMETSP0434-20130131/19052_1 /TAXON_ID=626734 ORGANISM="Favella taraikaensis, Strain Fe Narragansett Bay" /NCGR_SAMPLE_ID=MMETSP0434 /ASSEMBLY_ACC=CAM_ASM_000379 /LENGTH=138 /DNA_ID=CAMNT_0028200439 /DNA_START=703 /DNA_END=1119 /DNA_ORIENTATION=+